MDLLNDEEKKNKTGAGMGNGEEENKTGGVDKKRRGRMRKGEAVEQLNPRDQNKYFIDVSKEPETKGIILISLFQLSPHFQNLIKKILRRFKKGVLLRWKKSRGRSPNITKSMKQNLPWVNFW